MNENNHLNILIIYSIKKRKTLYFQDVGTIFHMNVFDNFLLISFYGKSMIYDESEFYLNVDMNVYKQCKKNLDMYFCFK